MNRKQGPPPISPEWWRCVERMLNEVTPKRFNKPSGSAERMKWFIDTYIVNNFHVFNKGELAEMWSSMAGVKPASSDFAHILSECVKKQVDALVPLFGLVVHYWPRALEAGSLAECCAPGCHEKRGDMPACEKHLCSLCGPLASEPEWQKRYYHICSTYHTSSYGVHIITLDPVIIDRLRNERARLCYQQSLDRWCYGVRRACLNCFQYVLPTPVDKHQTLTDGQKVCGSCWLYCQCRLCTNLISVDDGDRRADRVCGDTRCNTRWECKRCKCVRFYRTGSTASNSAVENAMCKTCQKEAYFCVLCQRTSNDLRDTMWCNSLVWKPSDSKPNLCMRCVPHVPKVKGIPFGGGRWVQLRAITLRLWWDRRALLAIHTQKRQENPVTLFQQQIAEGKMCPFARYLCQRDPDNWKVLANETAMWDSTYMLFIHLLRQPRDIFIKVLRLIVP